jgi:hypothetical protein
VIQYGDILETVGDAVEQHQDTLDLDVQGRVSLSPMALILCAVGDRETRP